MNKIAVFGIIAMLVVGIFGGIGANLDVPVADVSLKGGTPGNWTETYAPVMNATEDVFELLGDISSLLSEYSGTLTVLAITLVIVGAMGVIPLAFGIGLFLFAWNYGSKRYKKYN